MNMRWNILIRRKNVIEWSVCEWNIQRTNVCGSIIFRFQLKWWMNENQKRGKNYLWERAEVSMAYRKTKWKKTNHSRLFALFLSLNHWNVCFIRGYIYLFISFLLHSFIVSLHLWNCNFSLASFFTSWWINSHKLLASVTGIQLFIKFYQKWKWSTEMIIFFCLLRKQRESNIGKRK